MPAFISFRSILLWLAALMACAAISTAPATAKDYTYYAIGKKGMKTPGPVTAGLLLMGGGDRNFDAMRWFVAKAGHGRIVILRASYAGEIGEEFYKEIGGISYAETFVFTGRESSGDKKLLKALARADGIFIAGGDQARYVRYWKDTPVAAALTAHVASGKPIAGTSAGLAMLGEALYGAMDDGSITSAMALADPFGPANTIVTGFLDIKLLRGVITDTHFMERRRLGRLFAFVAKAQAVRLSNAPTMIGLGVDESAAVAVEADGLARVYATQPGGNAWVISGKALQGLDPNGPLRADNILVTGAGEGSVLHLPQGTVDNPVSRAYYDVRNGELIASDAAAPLKQ